jgi:hypothetical protein
MAWAGRACRKGGLLARGPKAGKASLGTRGLSPSGKLTKG